jgi:putative ATP-binding cassette transporter
MAAREACVEGDGDAPFVLTAPPRGAPVDTVVPPPEERSARADVVALLTGLGTGPQRRTVGLVTLAIVAVLVANMVGQVYLNRWRGDFFDAIERRDLASLGVQLLVFGGIVGSLLSLVVAQTWLHEILKLNLRAWMTNWLLDAWLVPGRAYRLGISAEAGVNPDQRMQEDARHASDLTADLHGNWITHCKIK